MTGNLSKAAELIRKAVGILETDPSENEEVLGAALSNLATILREIGTSKEAMAPARKALSILERRGNTEA